MMNFYIYTNPYKDPEQKVTTKVKEIISGNGGNVIETTDDADMENTMVIVLGGDGTILRAVRELPIGDGPVIGINLGTLGFLSEIELDNLEPSLLRLVRGDYKIEKRMLLEGEVVKSDGEKTETEWALNDVVLTRFGGLSIVSFEIHVNEQLLHEYLADGMIISTPTGSTGYNLSAMGPIASPAAELMILTPVCPHSLGQRSVILPSTDRVSIVIPPSKDGAVQQMELSFDGAGKQIVETGDCIMVRKSHRRVNIARLGKDSFLDTLGRKMSEK